MKTLLLLLTATITSGTAYAQIKTPAIEDPQYESLLTKRKPPRITGKLLHASADDLKKLNIEYSLVTFNEQEAMTAPIAGDGSFQLDIPASFPYQQVWFSLGNYFYAGIIAHTDLHIELDLQKLKASGECVYFTGNGVQYLGTDGPLNAYYNNFVQYRYEEKQALRDRIFPIITRQEKADNMLIAIDSIFQSLKGIVDAYTTRNPSPHAWLVEQEYVTDYYTNLCVLYWSEIMPDSLFKKIRDHKTYVVSNNSNIYYRQLSTYMRLRPGHTQPPNSLHWKDIASMPDMTDAEKAAIDSLRTAETLPPDAPYTNENRLKWVKQLESKFARYREEQAFARLLPHIDSLFTPAKADLLKMHLNISQDLEEQKLALEKIIPSVKTGWCRTIATGMYNQVLEKFAAIERAMVNVDNQQRAEPFEKPLLQTSFGATLYKVSGMSAEQFLARLKQSFPGKAIVFDLWAPETFR